MSVHSVLEKIGESVEREIRAGRNPDLILLLADAGITSESPSFESALRRVLADRLMVLAEMYGHPFVYSDDPLLFRFPDSFEAALTDVIRVVCADQIRRGQASSGFIDDLPLAVRPIASIAFIRAYLEHGSPQTTHESLVLRFPNLRSVDLKLIMQPEPTDAVVARSNHFAPPVTIEIPGPTRTITYHQSELIAQGGLGKVWKYRSADGALIAVKVPDFSRVPGSRIDEAIGRFKREIRAHTQLADPRVVKVLAARFETAEAWIAMEFIHGRSLQDEVRACSPLESDRALDLAIELCEAVSAIHNHGLTHRDLSPRNVMLHADGLKVIDLGLVKAESMHLTDLTTSNWAGGTPSFASPEQLQGGTITNRTDLYAIGAILYFMLTGRAPINAVTIDEACRAHLLDIEIPRIREINPRVSADLETIVHRCLARNPESRRVGQASPSGANDRFAVRELRDELLRIRRRKAIETRPLSSKEQLEELPKSQRKLVNKIKTNSKAVLTIAGGALILAGLIWKGAQWQHLESEREKRQTIMLQKCDASIAGLAKSADQGELEPALAGVLHQIAAVEDQSPFSASQLRTKLQVALHDLMTNYYLKLERPLPLHEADVASILSQLDSLSPREAIHIRASWTSRVGSWHTDIDSTSNQSDAWRFVPLHSEDAFPYQRANLMAPGSPGDLQLEATFDSISAGGIVSMSISSREMPRLTTLSLSSGGSSNVLAGYSDGRVCSAGISNQTALQQIEVSKSVAAVAHLGDLNTVAVATCEGDLLLYKNDILERSDSIPGESIRELYFVPNGDRVVVTGTNEDGGWAYVWRTNSGQLIGLAKCRHHQPPLVAISAQGERIAISIDDKSVAYGEWDDPIRKLQAREGTRITAIAWLGDRLIATLDNGDIVAPEQNDPLQSTRLCHAAGPIRALAIDVNINLAATATIDGRVELWDVNSWTLVRGPWTFGRRCIRLAFIETAWQRSLAYIGENGLVEVRHVTDTLLPSRIVLPPGTEGITFAMERSLVEDAATAYIFNGHELLAERQVADPGTSFELQATRDGRSLSLLVNNSAVAAANDALAGWRSAGTLSVLVPSAPSLTHVRTRKRRGAAAASELAEADRLAANTEYAQALVIYQKYSAPSGTPDLRTRAESEFKAVLCLFQLGRSEEGFALADQWIARMQFDSDDDLVPYALFWLWQQYTRATSLGIDQQIKKAEEIIRIIEQHYTLSSLNLDNSQRNVRRLIPHSMVAELSNWGLRIEHTESNIITTPERLEFVWKIGELLNDPMLLQVERELILVESLWLSKDRSLEPRLERVLDRLRGCVANSPESVAIFELWTASERLSRAIERRSWTSRIAGRRTSDELLSELAYWESLLKIHSIPAGTLIVLEKARVLYGCGRKADAKRTLGDLLGEVPARVDFGYGYYAQAWMMLGLLYREEGREDEARAAWRQVQYDRWQKHSPQHPLRHQSELVEEFTGRAYGLMALGLLAEIAPRHMADLRDALFVSLKKSYASGIVAGIQIMISHRLHLEKWDRYLSSILMTPHSQRLIQQLLWKTTGFRELAEDPSVYIVQQIVQRDWHVQELRPEERKLIELLIASMLDSVLTGEFSPWQAKQDLVFLLDSWDSADGSNDSPFNFGTPDNRLAMALKNIPKKLWSTIAFLFARRYATEQKGDIGRKFEALARQWLEEEPDDKQSELLKHLASLLDGLDIQQ